MAGPVRGTGSKERLETRKWEKLFLTFSITTTNTSTIGLIFISDSFHILPEAATNIGGTAVKLKTSIRETTQSRQLRENGMEKDNGLYELIYEYYESRILFGILKYGDQLSSVPKICASFRRGRNTVLAALDKLEEKGYIVTEERKVARVVYRADEATYRRNAANYFVPRREGILDFPCAGNLLFLPVWEAGLQNLERSAGTDMGTDTRGRQSLARSNTMPGSAKNLLDILCTFHNDLLLDLYWQFLRYINFLFDQGSGKPLLWHSDGEQGFDCSYLNLQRRVLNFVASYSADHPLENREQIPFKWTIYRRRPQVRYTLAALIIREILWERFPVGGYLPSMTKMAEQYQVSLSTVRRALSVLHALGVTRPYMGIGIRVSLEPADSDILATSEIQENLRLHGEGLQILALTVRRVTIFTVESATDEKREKLLQELKKLERKTSGILCMDVLLSFISRECPSVIIRECYGKLRELIAWGYIVSAVCMGSGQLDTDFADVITQLESDLQAGDLNRFAGGWQSFIESRMNFFHSRFPFKESGQTGTAGLKSIEEKV